MEEKVEGLPNVEGLAQFVQDTTKDKDQTAVQAQTQTQQTEELDLAQFKNPKDLLKSYKEVQGAFTRVTQENKAYKDELTRIREEFEIIKLQTSTPQHVQYAQPTLQAQDFDSKFIQSPEMAVREAASKEIQQRIVQEVLDDEYEKNPEEFNERYQYALMVKNQYPQLAGSMKGTRKLFELGDKLRTESMKRNAAKSVGLLLGEDVDFEKFRNLVKKDTQQQSGNTNLAFMPDTSSGDRSRSSTGQKLDYSTQINDAVKKGDVDSVLDNMFRELGVK